MTQYRFRTANRDGKWYNSLHQAQRFANAIGAGFLDPTGSFVAYRGTVLELRESDSQPDQIGGQALAAKRYAEAPPHQRADRDADYAAPEPIGQ